MSRKRRQSEEPIEDYLDELLTSLTLAPRSTRRLLSEAETHLTDRADELVEAGHSRIEAERMAVATFGSAADIASCAQSAYKPTLIQLIETGAVSLSLLGGLALAAIGASGVIAWVINIVAGPHFVGALPNAYSSETCHYYLHLHPSATSCGQAAMLENSRDAVSLRLLAGAGGLVLLAMRWWWLRTHPAPPVLRQVHGIVVAAAAACFAVAAMLLIGQSFELLMRHGSGGVGTYLTGGLVAAIAAVPCAFVALRHLKGIGWIRPTVL